MAEIGRITHFQSVLPSVFLVAQCSQLKTGDLGFSGECLWQGQRMGKGKGPQESIPHTSADPDESQVTHILRPENEVTVRPAVNLYIWSSVTACYHCDVSCCFWRLHLYTVQGLFEDNGFKHKWQTPTDIQASCFEENIVFLIGGHIGRQCRLVTSVRSVH